MAVYKTSGTTNLSLEEQHIYGSSRLGIFKKDKNRKSTTRALGERRYELTDHLGNVRVVMSDYKRTTVIVLSATDYYPFGMVARTYTSPEEYRYGFNGMEKDNENFEGAYDFGARILDVRLGRWLAVDPLWKNYESYSTYIFAINNPNIYIDIDGRDIVYFDENGKEITSMRVVSDKVFETWVQQGVTTGHSRAPAPYFEKAKMPNIIKGYEDPIYQQHDYQIAASTFLFNKRLANNPSSLPTYSKNHKLKANAIMPNELDPTLVKAMMIEESKGGTFLGVFKTGKKDPMQVNNPKDWTEDKVMVGLKKDQVMDPKASIDAAINWLYLKGMKSTKNGEMEWGNQDRTWFDAVEKYNGGGNPNYKDEVTTLYQNTIAPSPVNYKKDIRIDNRGNSNTTNNNNTSAKVLPGRPDR
jgi:RHS repeat-associated protein